MQEAFRERILSGSGREYPIECHDIRAKKSLEAAVRTPHYHEHIEFLYADRECDVSVWIGGERVGFKTGDMLIINSNASHTFVNNAALSGYVCIKALPQMLYSADNSFFDMKYALPFFKNSLLSYRYFSAEEINSSEIREAFRACLDEWNDKSYGYEVSVKSLVLRIFLWTVRYVQGINPTAEGGESNARLIQRSLEYINSNYTEVTEALAAAYSGMSCSHYSRQFRRVMGKSFREYVNVTRINAAEKLLLSTDMSVTEVALASGFATSSHFIERFKSVKGITPSKYRQTWVALRDLGK